MTIPCCIGISNGKDDLSYQRSYQLIPTITMAISSSPMPQSGAPHHNAAHAKAMQTTASELEEAIFSRLVSRDDINDSVGNYDLWEKDEEFDPVQIFNSDDAHLLRCRPLMSSDGEKPARTIFGISENAFSLEGRAQQGDKMEPSNSNSELPVYVTTLEPGCEPMPIPKYQSSHCCCLHPRGNWKRRKGYKTSNPKGSSVGGDVHGFALSYHANVKIVDLTKIQDFRRGSKNDQPYPCFHTPGRVFHLLRSVLNCHQGTSHACGGLHSASPWNEMYYKDSDNDALDCEYCAADQVVALIIKVPNAKCGNRRSNVNSQFWDDVERTEANEILNFRTGDAAPSYFLHSASQLSGRQFSFNMKVMTPIDGEETCDGARFSSNTLLLVYRRLPPRDVISDHRPGQEEKHAGCLTETYIEDAEEESELNIGLETPTQISPVVKHRIVSPPYQSHTHEYPGLFDSLLKRIDTIRKEAQTIPQWTAWPEQNHYAENTWNVFPLCYTFPANDVTQRTFIHKTCSFVPETTRLLQTLGLTLRTALFSRLDPRSRLGAHTGWSDLANHVLRVHIPLVVPGGKSSNAGEHKGSNYNTGLCGTWVDGCVETHDEDRIICFDDSKVHRAFNYSDEERIVLILDLARPRELPAGTATGGHSDELDAFISGFCS